MAAAAFYDLDGTLVRTNLVHAFAFTARNQQGLLKSVVKTVTTMASVPMFAAADFWNRRLFNDLFFVRYKGESEDRLRAMSQELFDTVLKKSIFPGAYELIDKSRQLGLRQVIVTGALDLTVEPLARHLKIDDYVTNRLEFVDGYATGRLLPPIMAAATKASWMRIYAEKENLNLSDCYGYSDSLSDLPMLSVVGHPTAVNPDIRLRSTALQHDWPVLDLR
ncbi:MAG TPA: HAD-IB family hydrolase [Polyangia bacterium]|jgi:HAD superfamily hydrolase (TIGR01490 family)|nr:HAD-IB family hydrolase [Polyangia bacterium]